MAAGTVELTTEPADALPPGPYRVEALIEAEDDTISDLTATDEHTLLRNGKPFVATGTSYMATDVHRRFLLEPNPIVWDGDFAAMRRAGINMIRTDIWTGWKKYMPEVGAANEAALWALDAFFLAARRHDIPVIFTFRAFLPEMWSGNNPYLDLRAVEAQKTFLALIAQRYSEMAEVIWDLINEPSFCSPYRLWLTRPNYDEHEERAWHERLRERFPAASDAERERQLAEMWRTLPELSP